MRNAEERNESRIKSIMSEYRVFCVSEIYDDIMYQCRFVHSQNNRFTQFDYTYPAQIDI